MALTAVGLGLACFARPWWLKVLALASLALPHLVGAPQPLAAVSLVPHDLVRTFQHAQKLLTHIQKVPRRGRSGGFLLGGG